MLRERDNDYGAIKFVDISSEDYSPEDNQGLDYTTVIVFCLILQWFHLNLHYIICSQNCFTLCE